MTLIECFTNSHIDNLAACLCLKPDRMILIGDARKMEEPCCRYTQILRDRGQNTEITLCDIQKRDLDEIYAVLNRLIAAQTSCVIDLSGGDELVMMAVGAVLAGLDAEKRSHIQVQRCLYERNVLLDCIQDDHLIPADHVALSVSEQLFLYGGQLFPDSEQPPEHFTAAQLEPLWELVCQSPKAWNRTISVLREFESRSDSQMEIDLPIFALRSLISGFEAKEEQVRSLLQKLDQRGVIWDNSDRNTLRYTYTSPIFRYCTQKAGNVLELKVLLEGRALEHNGAPFFADCRTGVGIDWDGIVYSPLQHKPETRNEIDVVLMHGVTPLFISCKNGNIGEEELYKLHTVAERFGGEQAKKMLVATDLDQKSLAANRAFIQRAWDMDIFLVTDAAQIPREEWPQIFLRAMGQT